MKYGEIIDIRLPSIKYNKHRRFCYIQFESSEQAQAALELHESIVEGDLKMSVQISNPAVKEQRHGALQEGRELYVANVDWTANDAELKEVFSKYGKVDSLKILTHESGKSKGTAFITFSTKVGLLTASVNTCLLSCRMKPTPPSSLTTPNSNRAS